LSEHISDKQTETMVATDW